MVQAMRNHRQRSGRARTAVLLAGLVAAWPAGAADGDVQRQLQLREQQQMELRLRMQQQLERSSRPPQTPSADLQMRTLDRDQQQRLQQFHDQQLRGRLPTAAQTNAEQMRQNLERQRALNAGGMQLSPFGAQRQIETPSGSSGP